MAEQIRWGLDNPHPLSQMKTELIWEGKNDEYSNRRTVDIARCAMRLLPVRTRLPRWGGGQVCRQTELHCCPDAAKRLLESDGRTWHEMPVPCRDRGNDLDMCKIADQGVTPARPRALTHKPSDSHSEKM